MRPPDPARPRGSRGPRLARYLPNQAFLEDRLSHCLGITRRYGRKLALLVLEIENLQVIHAALGPALADEFLGCVTSRLSHRVRESDTLARIGGNQLALLLSELRAEVDAARVAEEILESFADPIRLLGIQDYFVTLSVGIATHPRDGQTAADLLENARIAASHAKRADAARYHFYSTRMNHVALERLTLEQRLRAALRRGELTLSYQCQIDAATLRADGAEALLRWHHPELGVLAPGEFLALAEETRQIVPIGEWVLRAACRQAREWQSSIAPDFRIAVNVSAHQLCQPTFAELVREVLQAAQLGPESLELEISESCIGNEERHGLDNLERVRALGVRVSIDDFGTGYSSLANLKRLPVDALEIDRGFVQGVGRDSADTMIVAAITTLARGLGLAVVAEGVETEPQLRALTKQGCTRLQGFLFGSPLPAQEFARALQASPWKPLVEPEADGDAAA